MKNLLAVIVVFFLSLFVYTKLAGPIPFSINSVTTTKSDTFTVTGEGKVTVAPDVAVIQAGVQEQAATVKQAQDKLNASLNAIATAVKKLGISEKDIKTSQYSIYPTYDYTAGKQKITGYQASSNLTIKVRELDRANSVIDAATANGANQVGGISFQVDDPSIAENEARQKAVEQAKKKATDAARIAGFSLGRVINYQENTGGQPRPMPMYAQADAVMNKEAVPPTQVEPGTNEVTITVTLSYDIR